MNSEFDSYAGNYEEALKRGISVSGEDAPFFARGRIAWLGRCLRARGVSVKRVLDFGCGVGNATPFLFDLLNVESVIGVDLSEESLEVARRSHRHLAVDYRLTRDYRPDGSVDLVYCNGVFHHISEPERPRAMQYVFECLRPGGLFALWENNPWSPAARLVMSRIPFDRDAVMVWPNGARGLAKRAGLKPMSTDFLFIFPRPLGFLRGLEPALRKLPLGAQYQVLSQKAGTDSKLTHTR